MTEQQVYEVLGQPSWVVRDKTQIRGYLVRAEGCAAKTERVLVYDRSWWKEDLFVAIDKGGLVVCLDHSVLVKER